MGLFRLQISNEKQEKGSAFRTSAIKSMLSHAYTIDPLTLYFYTWSFLTALEDEETNVKLVKFYRLYRVVSMIIVPLAFISLYITIILTNGKYS